ncbi:MAG TPA: YceI family protein [Pricia antarctica]|uniref:YceI family protein n=1 Tax=Pricia antarctica TaxID=641691 RepID=A0A831QRD8_9FLAO|nr:YceI family protein [Pricia antarctica]
MAKLMIKTCFLFFICTCYFGFSQEKMIARQGQVSFFSYTSVENIEAVNNQVLSIIDFSSGEIAVNMLMRAFVFKKALMEEHFNESYIESDLYPKLQFLGEIPDFDTTAEAQTKIVKGQMTLHGTTNDLEIKTQIESVENGFVLTGNFEVGVSDYDINVPPLLRPNIAKVINVEFRFEFEPYEDE